MRKRHKGIVKEIRDSERECECVCVLEREREREEARERDIRHYNEIEDSERG